ncbi:E3 ubiquitin-protein like [Actinidia chinensis var. chinensis]|uniref:HECT-type E3 ubiquitin transferase n=1 Tax=Actinidia chinensis var. chinensis TaxID=1590841 RepID=A0A2R6QLZ8_ACTCC|nr:E3 ubiquitin-protein like [Actinidia chinensis var. chinensis]
MNLTPSTPRQSINLSLDLGFPIPDRRFAPPRVTPRRFDLSRDSNSSSERSLKVLSFYMRIQKSRLIKRLGEFLSITPRHDNELAVRHLQIFSSASAPAALVMLYLSPHEGNKECADESIRQFVKSSRNGLPKNLHSFCAPIVLEFCKLLGKAAHDDPLYSLCRSTLGSMVEYDISRGSIIGDSSKPLVSVQEIFPFVRELAARLSNDLVSSMESPTSLGPSSCDVRDFSAFLFPLHTATTKQVAFGNSTETDHSFSCYGEEIKFLHVIFTDLLGKMEKCLEKMEEVLVLKEDKEGEHLRQRWSQYLAILKELKGLSKHYGDAEEQLWTKLKRRKVSLCYLILRYATRNDNHEWFLERKDVTDFESRRHLVMLMLPEVKDEYDELHEMLIDRSQLLTESFEYIARADPEKLRGGLFMEFKNEEATGPGVLREWFFLVCQAIFNPQNALFTACPKDRRRFFPNPASKVHPLHLEYFSFSGRVIALALMHKVQVGIVFDRVFFLQLAGAYISLEDIHDADPCLYKSCKEILEMDAEMIDSDALGLTFVHEVEELGSRKIVELCSGGKSISVNSRNRGKYVDLLIKHRFVTSITEQVAHFAQGFADILCNSKLQNFFFKSLELEDLDWMLYGSETTISVEDWKAHTEYNGYRETDPQIIWFWKIVGEMSADKRKVLLFFWTSVKYLPVEGFGGLASRLCIYKTSEPHNRLPSSHTCFYQLSFPPYPSLALMQDHLHIITQEHVGCSFGTW